MVVAIKILIPVVIMVAVKYDALRDRHMKDIYVNSMTYCDRFRGWTEKLFFPIMELIFDETWHSWTYGQKLWHLYKELSMFSLYSLLCFINLWLYDFQWYSIAEVMLLAFVCHYIWNYFYGGLK